MLLIFCVSPGDWVSLIPMPALVAIMIMVSVGTFSWASLVNLRHHPHSSSAVMLAAVAAVPWAHNLAIRMLVGVLLSGLFFTIKIARLLRMTMADQGDTRTWRVEGPLFYGSVEDFTAAFDYRDLPLNVVIGISAAHIWDISPVQARDMVVAKLRAAGAQVSLRGINAASSTIIDQLGRETRAHPGEIIAPH